MLILGVVPTETFHPEASAARVGHIVQSTSCSGQITAPCVLLVSECGEVMPDPMTDPSDIKDLDWSSNS